MYTELYRQANKFQEKLDGADLVLSVIAGKASDVISIAASKSLKNSKKEQIPDRLNKKPQKSEFLVNSPVHMGMYMHILWLAF